MKNLLEAAEDYTKQAGWRDLAELKCCMCALGLLLGLAVPRRWRKKAGRGAAVLCAATCIPQAAKFPLPRFFLQSFFFARPTCKEKAPLKFR